jgi:hypothetical protein
MMVLMVTTANSAILFAWTAREYSRLRCWGHSMSADFTFSQVLSVFPYTSVALGGLGLSISHSSAILGITWCMNTLMSMLGFSQLIASQGVAGTLRIIAAAACALFVLVPLCNISLRSHTMILFWPVLVISGLLAAFIVLLARKCILHCPRDPFPKQHALKREYSCRCLGRKRYLTDPGGLRQSE